MLCKIADLLVEIPAAGGMTPRCEDYLHDSEACPDIQILSVDVCMKETTYVKRAEIKEYLLEILMEHCEVNVSR